MPVGITMDTASADQSHHEIQIDQGISHLMNTMSIQQHSSDAEDQLDTSSCQQQQLHQPTIEDTHLNYCDSPLNIDENTRLPLTKTPSDIYADTKFEADFSKCIICSESQIQYACSLCKLMVCKSCIHEHSCVDKKNLNEFWSLSRYASIISENLKNMASNKQSHSGKFSTSETPKKQQLNANPNSKSSSPLNHPSNAQNNLIQVDEHQESIESSEVSCDESAEADRRLKLILEHTTKFIDSSIESLKEFQHDYNEKLMNRYSRQIETDDEKSSEFYKACNFIDRLASKSLSSRFLKNSHTKSNGSDSNKNDVELNILGATYFIQSVNLVNSYLNDMKNFDVSNIDVEKECKLFDLEICNKIQQNLVTKYSRKNPPMTPHLTPDMLLNRFSITESVQDMFVNEFANVSFKHIYDPPGMSPMHSMVPPVHHIMSSPHHNSPIVSHPHHGLLSLVGTYSPHTTQIINDIQMEGMDILPMSQFQSNQQIVRPSPKGLSTTSLPVSAPPTSNSQGKTMLPTTNSAQIQQNFDQSKVDPQFNARHTNRKTLMQIRRKFGELGPAIGQFNSPHGFCIDIYGNILIADTNNHRVLFFTKEGELFHYFGNPGKSDGQIWYPRKIAVYGKDQNVIVCDRGSERSRMQIFSQKGEFIRRIAIRYVDIVASIVVHETDMGAEIIIVDSVSPTVYVIGESGDILSWFDCSDYMKEPSDLAVYGEYFLICDFKGHRVCVFRRDGTYVTFFGSESITNFPNGIDVLVNGNILVGDSHGNRFHIVVYNQKWQQVNEFECPFVKVSRCCGLKVTPDGCIITLAKNNHHVLILNQIPYTISAMSSTQHTNLEHSNKLNKSCFMPNIPNGSSNANDFIGNIPLE